MHSYLHCSGTLLAGGAIQGSWMVVFGCSAASARW